MNTVTRTQEQAAEVILKTAEKNARARFELMRKFISVGAAYLYLPDDAQLVVTYGPNGLAYKYTKGASSAIGREAALLLLAEQVGVAS